jgi:hypothetical protein
MCRPLIYSRCGADEATLRRFIPALQDFSDRRANNRACHDVDAAVVEHPFEASPREEANVASIEQPTLVVVEAP